MQNFFRNETKSFKVTFTDDGGNPIDLTGATVTIVFSKNREPSLKDAAIYAVADTDSNGANGVANFTLTPEDTNVATGNYYYQVRRSTDAGDVTMYPISNVRILPHMYN